MKKIILIIMTLFLVSGCHYNNDLESATIYTTVYPLTYITEYIFGEDNMIKSIYPNDVDLKNYTLTEKQIDEYAKGNYFIHLGLNSEKDTAKSFRNSNKDLLLINATYELYYKYDIKELWLAPSNFLELAKNIKNSLQEYIDNSVIEDNIEAKYNELYIKASWLDAELRNVEKEASAIDNNTIVVAKNSLKFLDDIYKFNVISIEELENLGSENAINDLKAKFKNSKYTAIIKIKGEENSSLITELLKDNNIEIIELDNMITNSDTSSDYLTIENENIAKIRNLLIK